MAEAEYVLARKILKLANRIVSGRNTDIRDLGLTSSQADSLVYFVHNEGRSAVDLKDHLGVTHQTARGIVKRMAEKNLIEIRISEEDGRYRRIFVTEKGRSLYRQMEKKRRPYGKPASYRHEPGGKAAVFLSHFPGAGKYGEVILKW